MSDWIIARPRRGVWIATWVNLTLGIYLATEGFFPWGQFAIVAFNLPLIYWLRGRESAVGTQAK